jgi:hypothetical protein
MTEDETQYFEGSAAESLTEIGWLQHVISSEAQQMATPDAGKWVS